MENAPSLAQCMPQLYHQIIVMQSVDTATSIFPLEHKSLSLTCPQKVQRKVEEMERRRLDSKKNCSTDNRIHNCMHDAASSTVTGCCDYILGFLSLSSFWVIIGETCRGKSAVRLVEH